MINEYLRHKQTMDLWRFLSSQIEQELNDICRENENTFTEWMLSNYPEDIYSDYERDEGYEHRDVEDIDFEIKREFAREIEPSRTAALMEYDSIVYRQWLVHFSDSAREIATSGFDRGESCMRRLSLTSGSFLEPGDGCYNFAYTIPDAVDYAPTLLTDKLGKSYTYGSEAVLFRASGVRVWHDGDMEHQTIFWNSDAEDLVLVANENNKYCIKLNNGKRIWFESVIDAAYWVDKNYAQYKRALRITR